MRARRTKAPGRQHGSVYLGMLVAMSIFGLMLTQTTPLGSSHRLREREADLLAKGNEIRRAIGRYYVAGRAAGKYPPALDDLVVDKRQARTQHHLRRVYRDPMTNGEWGIVRAPDGGIMGVFSQAPGTPFKQGDFDEADTTFAGKGSYAGWIFLYTPQPLRPSRR